MQAIMETLFDIVYLFTVIALGIRMVRGAQGRTQVKWFGIMAIVLGCGDAFHLVPRAVALCTDGLANHAAALGFGKLVTSITMTVFYVILYRIAQKRYTLHSRALTGTVYALAAVRIALCCLPQNRWLSPDAPLFWGILRNIPFAALGILIIVLFFREAKKAGDAPLRHLWLAVTLSFGFYIPVVLFADTVPPVGILMIPKTCAYVWIVCMGLGVMKSDPVRS
jgi:hypothetical protein